MHSPLPFERKRPSCTLRGSDRDSGGFVLVAVLLLIALATVLIVTTSGVSQIERKAVSNSAKEQIAKQNALFALQIALAQLQSAAGPDQRVTATADILNTNTAVAPTVANPYWTGVWTTGTNGLDIVNSGTPQRTTSLGDINPTTNQIAANARAWLVSGSTNYNTLTPTASTVSPLTWSDTSTGQTNSVALALNYGTNSTYQTVRVPLIRMTNTYLIGSVTHTNFGGYAYWVSDEGVKAKANIADPTYNSGSTNTNNILHFLITEANNTAKGLLGSANPVDLRPNTNSVIHAATLPSLQFVTNSIAANSLSGTNASALAADATTYSMGVICDVMRGGLKKDLTAAFEDTGATPTINYGELNPGGTNRVYTAGVDTIGDISGYNASPNKGLDGLRWLNLYFYYNLYKGVLPTAQSTFSANPSTPPKGVTSSLWYSSTGLPPYTVAPNALGWKDSTFPVSTGTPPGGGAGIFGVLSPVLLGERWDVCIQPVVGNTFQLNYYFQLILYNPYAVAIKSNLQNFRYGRALSSASNYLETAISTNATSTNYFYTGLNDAATLQRDLFVTSFRDSATFQPGEIRVFGLNANSPQTSIVNACQVLTNSPNYGLVSIGASPTFNQNTPLQYITNLGSAPSNDVYASVPAGTFVGCQLCTRPTNSAGILSTSIKAGVGYSNNIVWSQFNDTSIQGDVAWQTVACQGGSIVGIGGVATKNGCRFMTCNSPWFITLGTTPAPSTPSTAITSLSAETPLLSIYIRKKGILSSSDAAKYANSSTIIPYFCGNSTQFNVIYDRYGSGNWDEVYQSGYNGNTVLPPTANTTLTASNYLTTSWGNYSTGVESAYNNKILCDVPIQPMVSLGQFMHMQPFYIDNSGSYTDLAFGSMFTGGSYASPEVPLNQTVFDNASTLAFDNSFLANQALFDKYFFSTVPPANFTNTTVYPAFWSAFNAANSGTTLSDPSKPLLNSRMKPYYRGSTNPPLMADLRDMDKAAANLLLDGAFNVNSTSVNAWKALLSSLAGNTVSMYYGDANGNNTNSYTSTNAPIFRFWSANGNGSTNSPWSGVRDLTDSDLTNLAQQIVNQVKIRGPFLSMADFLNRRLGAASTDLTRAGALQEAIDHTTLNNTIKTGRAVTGPWASTKTGPRPITANMYDASSSAGSVWDSSLGMPGYLMQQDLVQCFSPAMSVRSDTFVIRVYGESRNPMTRAVEGSAYAEAVVQRTPEFMDQNDVSLGSPVNNATSITSVNSINQTFGRRFKIISFRWLNPNEI